MNKDQDLYEIIKDQEINKESIDVGVSLEKWRELGRNGAVIPMKIPLHGTSMWPFIRSEKDIVTIIPLVRNPMVGDIVLFRGSRGKNVVHRVYKVFPDGIQTWGDNCQRPDLPRKCEEIYGLIVSVERNGQTYQIDTAKQRAYGIRWMKYGRPVWMMLKKILKIRLVHETVHPR